MIDRLTNATRLSERIYLGYIVFGVLALIMLAVAYTTLKSISDEFNDFSAAGQRHRDALLVAQDIAMLQRAVQVYIDQGHKSAAEQVTMLYNSLQTDLAEMAEQPLSTDTQKIVTDVTTHLAIYYRTFGEVRRLRELQVAIIQQDIPLAARVLLESIERLPELVTDKSEMLQVTNRVLLSEVSAYRYFETLSSADVDGSLSALDRARARLNASTLPGSELQATLAAMGEYERLFLQGVQRTRGYIYLVNVVMAAEVYEMLYQSNELAEQVSASMRDNERAIATVVPRSIAAFFTFGALLLVLLFLLPWLLGQSIVRPIRLMTTTFQRLASGAGDEPIPEFSSDDQLSELARAAAVFRDKNNETRALLERYQALSESLEVQVEQRTRQLQSSNLELRSARDAAEAAAQAKSEFLANMSHEIRTPVHALQGHLQLLENTELSQEQKELTRDVWVCNKTLSLLLNQILDFSKIEAEKMELEDAPVNLYELLDDLETQFKGLAKTKGLSLKVDIAEAFPEWVRADATRLTQILMNLLSNALKFTDEGSIVVLASAQDSAAESPGKREIRLEVQDSGIGIAEDKLQRIFESFTQAEGRTTRAYGGTGLGLTIARRLVELMGGKLNAVSKPGEGSSFIITLELPELSAEEILAQSLDGKNETVDINDANSLAGITILLVEDNPSLQKMTRLLLEQQGARIVVASHGREALEVLRAADTHFDVVLMDLQMPVMGGIDAAEAIRQRWSHDELPVIAMTANATRHDRDAARQVGMNDFISKPIDLFGLVRALHRNLPSEPGAGRTVSQPAAEPVSTQHVPDFPGFDLAAALARMTNDTGIYRASAAPFISGHPAMLEKLSTAAASGDHKGAAAICHELKGVAGLIGAEHLAELASEVDQLFREGPAVESGRAQVDRLSDECYDAVATLQQILTLLEKGNSE